MAKKGRARAAPRKGGLAKAQGAVASSRKDHLKVAKKPKCGLAKSSKKHTFKRKADAAAAEAGIESGVIPHGYEDTMRTLLVGEGNFSFARALVRLFDGNGFGLTATAYDSREVCLQKYHDAADILQEVEASGARVLFGVDAGALLASLKLAKKYKQGGDAGLNFEDRFDRVVFNFPHAGLGIKDQDVNVTKNQELLQKFFLNANEVVRVGGQVHVALKRGKPYDLWNTQGLAHRTSGWKLALRTELKFHVAAFPGYSHRRTLGFKPGLSPGNNEEIAGMARTFVFEKIP